MSWLNVRYYAVIVAVLECLVSERRSWQGAITWSESPLVGPSHQHRYHSRRTTDREEHIVGWRYG